jgi:hypothetical protein
MQAMHTKDKLADALLKIGLLDMSLKARSGYYHDFLSPLDLPEMALITALGAAASRDPERAAAIDQLRQRVIEGEFDASEEESEEWAKTPEAQELFRKLAKGE